MPSNHALLRHSGAHDVELLFQDVIQLDFGRIATRLRLNRKYTLASSPLFQGKRILEKDCADVEVLDWVEILRLTRDLIFSGDLLAVLGCYNSRALSVKIARTTDSLKKIGHYYRPTRQLVSAAKLKKCRLFRNIRIALFDINVPADVEADQARKMFCKFLDQSSVVLQRI